MIAGSQTIADDRRRSQTIAEDRTWFYLLPSSAIVCDHDRRIAGDRRRSQKCVSIWSQTIAELSAICDPRSSAIIWKPALRDTNFSPGSTRFFFPKSTFFRNKVLNILKTEMHIKCILSVVNYYGIIKLINNFDSWLIRDCVGDLSQY